MELNSKLGPYDAELTQLSQEVYSELSEIHEQKVRPKIVQYQVAASFEFGRDGSVLVRCPHCGHPKPQTGKLSEVQCPACSQTYIVPKKVLDMI